MKNLAIRYSQTIIIIPYNNILISKYKVSEICNMLQPEKQVDEMFNFNIKHQTSS